MSKRRRRFGAEFKFKVSLEAAKGTKTLNELSSELPRSKLRSIRSLVPQR
jgi:hypothetical protein